MRAPLIFPTLAAVAFLATPHDLHAQQIGIQGGLNRAAIQGDAPPNAQYGGGFGFMAGLVFDLPIASDVFLSLQPMYAQRGTAIAFAVEGEEEPRDSLDVKLTYISVPLLAKIRAAHGRTFVTGGLLMGGGRNSRCKPLEWYQPDGIPRSAGQLPRVDAYPPINSTSMNLWG